MKWIYLIKFLIYGGIGVYDISIQRYSYCAGWFMLAMMVLAFWIVEELKPSKVNNTQEALNILIDELNKADVRKYTCLNQSGYSLVERNIVERILKL